MDNKIVQVSIQKITSSFIMSDCEDKLKAACEKFFCMETWIESSADLERDNNVFEM